MMFQSTKGNVGDASNLSVVITLVGTIKNVYGGQAGTQLIVMPVKSGRKINWEGRYAQEFITH